MSSYSGDAAEQVVHMSLEGAEVAVKLAGTGAKQLAVLLYAVLKDQKKTSGKIRLTNLLRSGKELKVFAYVHISIISGHIMGFIALFMSCNYKIQICYTANCGQENVQHQNNKDCIEAYAYIYIIYKREKTPYIVSNT